MTPTSFLKETCFITGVLWWVMLSLYVHPEQNDEQTVDLPVIWDDMALMWSCDVIVMRFMFSRFLRRPIAVLWGTRQSLNNQPFPGINSSCTVKNNVSHWRVAVLNVKQELPLRKQIRPRPSGFELNQYGQECTPVMKNSSSERKTKNTQDCQKLKFYQIQIN